MKIKSLHYIIAMCSAALLTLALCSGTSKIIVPKPLKPGSKVAIITPASAVKDSYIDTAIIKLKNLGYQPVVMPCAYGNKYGSYAATDKERAKDIMDAFTDPEIDAILCSRGGYGTVRLLSMLDSKTIRQNPKWLIGYSDISDLHAFMYHAGVASIHGPMAGHISSEPDDNDATIHLFELLAKGLPYTYEIAPNPYNNPGTAKGRLVGGNLMCIDGLSQTPYDVMNPDDGEDIILFFEDVSEQIYRIERILMRMHLNGSLSRLKGLIIGQFTDYKPSSDFQTMEDMIHHWLRQWGYYDSKMPIVFDFPTGHVSENYPLVVGANATLEVSPETVKLKLDK